MSDMSTPIRVLRRIKAKFTARRVRSSPFYSEWMRSLEEGRTPLSDQIPWITFAAREFLVKNLRPTFTVFEYGSGGSTLFFAQRVKEVVTVEHDPDWHGQVQVALRENNVSNCTLSLIPPTLGLYLDNTSPADPLAYASANKTYLDHHFYDYVTLIDQYPDEHFDLVAVDGRARPSCINHAQSKVKKGGFLLLDNAERDWYQGSMQLLDGWNIRHSNKGLIPYIRGHVQTTIWEKSRAD